MATIPILTAVSILPDGDCELLLPCIDLLTRLE
jgi:hypothetical protein